MPITPTYPGVYVEEIPSGVHTITGVTTSTTAFVGSAKRGLTDTPVTIFSFNDFTRSFGGLSTDSTMSYAVKDFYNNGGGKAMIIRVTHGDATASTIDAGNLKLRAISAGKWGDQLRIRIDYTIANPADPKGFNLTLSLREPTDPNNPSSPTRGIASESFLNVSIDPKSPRFIGKILAQSSYVELNSDDPNPIPNARPTASDAIPSGDPFADSTTGNPYYHSARATLGNDGSAIDDADLSGDEAAKTGFHALLKLNGDIFNLLCIPPPDRDGAATGDSYYTSTLSLAQQFCLDHRAMLIMDAPNDWPDANKAATGFSSNFGSDAGGKNAAMFFPRIQLPDSLADNVISPFAPSGTMAGLFARTDAARRLEGACRHRRHSQWRAITRCAFDRRSKRPAQSARSQLPASFPDLRPRLVGRSHAVRLRSPCLGMEVHPREAHRTLHRREPLPRAAMGRLRAQ